MKSTYTSEGNFLGFKFGKSIDIPKILAIPFWILYGITHFTTSEKPFSKRSPISSLSIGDHKAPAPTRGLFLFAS